jgi:acyl-CoA synthetase (NDP forming)
VIDLVSFFRKKVRKKRKTRKGKKRIKKSRSKKVKKVKAKARNMKRPKARKIKKTKSRRMKVAKRKSKVKMKKKVQKKTGRTRKKEVKPIFKKMPDEKAFLILKRYRIKVPNYGFCKNEKELLASLKKVGFPCVLKATGEIIHKTDVNGVRTNIGSREEAIKNFKELMKIKGCEKVLVQKAVKGGYELIVGGKKDPQFNRVVALGAGGIFTDFLKDVSFRIVPLSKRDAEEMLKEVKFSDLILRGFRGKKPADRGSIVDTIISVSRIMEKYPNIKELDINPLFAMPTKAVAADVRIILE